MNPFSLTGILAVASVASAGLVGCLAVASDDSVDWIKVDGKSPVREDKVVKTDTEWLKQLGPESFRILRNKGTEPAFCSPWHDQKRPGVYHCLGCDLPLFQGTEKFVSGTGWPSFFRPIKAENVWTKMDYSIPGMPRVEILCSRCDGHLGHVFPDGPKPTGLRYCINAQAMKFVPKGEEVKPQAAPRP